LNRYAMDCVGEGSADEAAIAIPTHAGYFWLGVHVTFQYCCAISLDL
jgi:hypothetical protein